MADNKNIELPSLVMQPQIRLLPDAISDLFATASTSGCITLADRYGLLAALLEDSLTSEERHCIDRLLHAVRKRRLMVVDEISAML